jgi:signal transduction histidine kinase
VQEDKISGFDENDANLLRSLASRIAISLENAQLYKGINDLNAELTDLNADKDRFFSIVAHDLRSPFTPLLGNAELLLEMAEHLTPKEVKEISGGIYRSAKLVLGLLENLLQWSRLQMGRMEYQPADINLKDVAQQTVDLLGANAINKNITLHNEINDHVMVYADDYMLDTIIRNLTSNALKFTPQGGKISISAIQNEKFIEVSITDTGVGISEADKDKLFKIDVQHSTVGTEKEAGTGLGLLLCKEMVEMNGGQIGMESELGQGTTFKFTMPAITTDR